MLNTIKKFTAAFSVAGDEGELRELIEKEISPYVDNVSVDPVGNLIAFKKGKDSNKKLMIAAHMDEIGFVVTYIEDSGIIRVHNIGGIQLVQSAFHTVRFKNGITGVLCIDSNTKPEDIKIGKFFIDIGAKNKKEAEKKVKIGNACAVVPSFKKLGASRYTAKAFDDRIGCAVALGAAKNVKVPAYDTYYVFTVQEEVGCRGSKPASFYVMPDYAIAVDVTTAGDVPGEKNMPVKLGGGAAIKLKDKSVICSKLITDRLTELAVRDNIKYQYEILTVGGTDTSSMQIAGSGSMAGCISVPCRYIHSPVEVVDLTDVKACEALLTTFTENGIE